MRHSIRRSSLRIQRNLSPRASSRFQDYLLERNLLGNPRGNPQDNLLGFLQDNPQDSL
jgi:hypothetical protein